MKGRRSSIILIVSFLIGLFIVCYPAISDAWNTRVQSRAIAVYEGEMNSSQGRDYTADFEAAHAYNAAIAKVVYPLIYFDKVPGYDDLLDIGGTGVMGYIKIPKIDIEIPIYHGTSKSVLNVAAGHLQGSSLPVGGAGTHAVISAHRGLPGARLFTDLNRMEPGDTFQVKVLDCVLTYQVTTIEVVEPDQVDSLEIVEGKDLFTLVTCTPFGINTHRLLVHAQRIEGDVERILYVPYDAYKIDPLMVAPFVAAPILLTLLVVILIKYR